MIQVKRHEICTGQRFALNIEAAKKGEFFCLSIVQDSTYLRYDKYNIIDFMFHVDLSESKINKCFSNDLVWISE